MAVEEVILNASGSTSALRHELDSEPAFSRLRSHAELDGRQFDIVVNYRMGSSCRVIDAPLERGESSRNLRVIEAGLVDGRWNMTVQDLAGRPYGLEFTTAWTPRGLKHAELGQRTPGGFQLETITPPKGAGKAPSLLSIMDDDLLRGGGYGARRVPGWPYSSVIHFPWELATHQGDISCTPAR